MCKVAYYRRVISKLLKWQSTINVWKHTYMYVYSYTRMQKEKFQEAMLTFTAWDSRYFLFFIF